jgi:cell division protein FtsI (penicillin-binding protein 3)
LQLAQAYAAFGSDGQIRPVSLVKLDKPNEGERIMASETATVISRMMEEVVRPGGTGDEAGVLGYRVAGKTGTSWKFSAGGGYSEDEYFSVFAGLAPASNPKLATVVIIDEPTGDLYYGGDVAAPVFGEVMTESLRLLAVPPDSLPAGDHGALAQAMSQ